MPRVATSAIAGASFEIPNPIGCSLASTRKGSFLESQLRDVLEIEHQYRLALELRVHE